MTGTLNRGLLCAAALAATAITAGCSKIEDENPETVTIEDGNRTLAVTLSDAGNLGTLSGAISSANLSSVFDGQGSYTLLAPKDAAFEKLGEQGDALMKEEQQPLLVAVLRDHILPGHLTPEAIEKAIADQAGPVSVSTLGEGTVTFAKDGDAIVVSNQNGVKAHFAGSAMAATNGVVIPLDAVLLPPQEPVSAAQ